MFGTPGSSRLDARAGQKKASKVFREPLCEGAREPSQRRLHRPPPRWNCRRYSGMKRSQLTQNVIVWALPTIVILAVVPWLIENSSKEFAVFLIHATNALFYMALLGVLYRQGSLRVFWAFFAIAAWLYLFAETRYLPHIYYLSPAPFLSIFSDYHNSISKAEVIGDSLAMLCVAWNVGWLARVGYVAVLWILYRAYLGLALQWMFCGNRCQGARQIVQGP